MACSECHLWERAMHTTFLHLFNPRHLYSTARFIVCTKNCGIYSGFILIYPFIFLIGSERQIQGLGITTVVRQLSRNIVQEGQRWLPTKTVEMRCRSKCSPRRYHQKNSLRKASLGWRLRNMGHDRENRRPHRRVLLHNKVHDPSAKTASCGVEVIKKFCFLCWIHASLSLRIQLELGPSHLLKQRISQFSLH